MNNPTLNFNELSFDFEVALFENQANKKSLIPTLLLSSLFIHVSIILGVYYFVHSGHQELIISSVPQPLEFSLIQKYKEPEKSIPNAAKAAQITNTSSNNKEIITTEDSAYVAAPVKPNTVPESDSHNDNKTDEIQDTKKAATPSDMSKTVSDLTTSNISEPELPPITEAPILGPSEPQVFAQKKQMIDSDIISTNASDHPLQEQAKINITSPSPIETETVNLNTLISDNIKYPQLALKRGIQGLITLDITFGSDGYYQKIEVAQSSGSNILDKAAISTAKKSLKKQLRPMLSDLTVQVQIQYKLTR